MQAGIVTADVAQGPGDVGVAGLPVGVAVELGDLADLVVEQLGHGGVEDGVVADDLLCGVLARLGRSVESVVDGGAQCLELGVQRVDPVADSGAVVERAGQRVTDLVHLRQRAVGIPAVLVVQLGAQFRIDRRGAEQQVGGKAALRIHVARDFADRPHHFEPALGDRDLVHRLVFDHRHVDGEAAADGGKRNDGGGEQRADFHGN